MHWLATWIAAAVEDISLVTDEYLPEMLVIGVMVVLLWLIRRTFARDARSSL